MSSPNQLRPAASAHARRRRVRRKVEQLPMADHRLADILTRDETVGSSLYFTMNLNLPARTSSSDDICRVES